jgi:hypothetical protein
MAKLRLYSIAELTKYAIRQGITTIAQLIPALQGRIEARGQPAPARFAALRSIL